MGIADYLLRHPSENHCNENKIKAEELGNSWFTVYGIIRNDKSVSATTNRKSSTNQNQPIGEQLASEGNTQFKKNWQMRSKWQLRAKLLKQTKRHLNR